MLAKLKKFIRDIIIYPNEITFVPAQGKSYTFPIETKYKNNQSNQSVIEFKPFQELSIDYANQQVVLVNKNPFATQENIVWDYSSLIYLNGITIIHLD